MQALPNFFVVGAPKAGTTSLYHHLDQHPEIYMSPIKEPCYFSSEVRPENFCEEYALWAGERSRETQEYLRGPMKDKRFSGMVLDWDDYLKLFENVNGQKAIGEASVCYLWSATAAANIAAKVPTARIVMVLRDPAERAFSQYLHAVSMGLVRKSFREQIQSSSRSAGARIGVMQPFLQFGMYSEQVKRYLDLFPRENISIHFFEDRSSNLLGDMFRFLGVDATFAPDTSRRHLEPRVPRSVGAGYLLKKSGVWRSARALTPHFLKPMLKRAIMRKRESLAMEPADRRYLVSYYREDIGRLAHLVDRDLSRWLRT